MEDTSTRGVRKLAARPSPTLTPRQARARDRLELAIVAEEIADWAGVDPSAEPDDGPRHKPSMSNMPRDPRLVPVPDPIRQHAARLIGDHGPREAARKLGVSRATALSLAAGLAVMPGSIALATLAMASGEQR